MYAAPCQVGKVEFADPYQRTVKDCLPKFELPPWKNENPHLAALAEVAQRERLIRDLGLNEDELSILDLLAQKDHLADGGNFRWTQGTRVVRLLRCGLVFASDAPEDGLIQYRITEAGKALVGK